MEDEELLIFCCTNCGMLIMEINGKHRAGEIFCSNGCMVLYEQRHAMRL